MVYILEGAFEIAIFYIILKNLLSEATLLLQEDDGSIEFLGFFNRATLLASNHFQLADIKIFITNFQSFPLNFSGKKFLM